MYNSIMFQIVGFLVGGFMVATAASIAWPKFSTNPRPMLLEKVYDYSKDTKVGSNIEHVLGVADATDSADVVGNVLESVKVNAQSAIRMKIVEGLLQKYYELPENEQTAVKQQVCEPQDE